MMGSISIAMQNMTLLSEPKLTGISSVAGLMATSIILQFYIPTERYPLRLLGILTG